MATITLSLPDELKKKMDSEDWINWSSVARESFLKKLEDVQLLARIEKVRKISEIDENDHRKVKESVLKDMELSVNKTLRTKKTYYGKEGLKELFKP